MAAFDFDFDANAWVPPESSARPPRGSAPHARRGEKNGQWIEAQNLTAELGLLPGWDAPSPVFAAAGDGTG